MPACKTASSLQDGEELMLAGHRRGTLVLQLLYEYGVLLVDLQE
jgi:hypothetical protein